MGVIRPPSLTRSVVCLRAAWALSAFFSLTACVPASIPIDGGVTEAGTEHPLPGAIVAVVWEADGWENTYCYHVQTGETDDIGHYRIPFQADVLTSKEMGGRVAGHYAYKRGYRDIWSVGFISGLGKDSVTYSVPDPSLTSATLVSLGLANGKPFEPFNRPGQVLYTQSPLPAWWHNGQHDLLLVPDTSAPAARLEYLSKLTGWTSCYGAGSRNRNLVPFYKQMAEEAIEIAVTESDKKKAASICRDVGAAATATDKDSGDYEKRSLDYLRERYPKCWGMVLEASRESQRIVLRGCRHDGRCSVSVKIRTCDLEGCEETSGTPTQDEWNRFERHRGGNSTSSPRIEPASRSP